MTGRPIQETLQDREAILTRILAVGPLGIGLLHNSTITWANERLGHLLGYPTEELIGRPMAEFCVDRKASDRMETESRRQLRVNGWAEIETRLKRKDGTLINVLLKTAPISLTAPPADLLTMALDISDHKRVEERLRESEEKYRELVEHAPAGICELDLQTLKLTNVNEVICEYLGHSREEIQSMNFLDMFSEDSRQFVIERQRKVLSGEKVRDTAEYNLTRKDGREFWILVNTKAYFQDGIPTRATFVVHDITERKRLEGQLRQAQKMEAVGRLAGGIAHDFNNLLTGLVGHVHLLSESLAQDDALREHVDEIKEAGERAASLTRQLLAFSRKQVMRPRILDLDRLIMNLEKMLCRIIGEHIQLVRRLVPGQHFIEADSAQIEQLIVNLAINARDAMSQGGELTLETDSLELENAEKWPDFEVPPGSYVRLVVTDTGSGMDEETRSRVFEPFFTTKDVGKGTGLGLSSVYGIVRQSGGYIGVRSAPSAGTVFTLYLPGREAELEREIEMAATGELPKGEECVLIVEDDDRVRRLCVRILRRLGYRVHEVKDAERAVRFVEGSSENIDLLLTDIVMPGMNGWDLAQRVQERLPDIKTLFMTGYSSEAVGHESILPDDEPILQKPFTPQALAQAVRRVLNGP
jgi:two-component system cell cycle sensor histidine kinase/response regulator CckA